MSEMDRDLFFKVFGSGDFDTPCDGVYAGQFDRQVIVAMARHVNPEVVIEYGLNIGRMAKILLNEIPSIFRYIGIDAISKSIVADNQKQEFPDCAGSLVDDSRLEILLRPSEFELPCADLIYIDGGHTYDCVRRDTLEAMETIKKGGVILWHDYNRQENAGVCKCIDELNSDHRICLVKGTHVCFRLY